MRARYVQGNPGKAIATAQTIGVNISLPQLNTIQANPLNYLWSAPKATAEDQCLSDLCDGSLGGFRLKWRNVFG